MPKITYVDKDIEDWNVNDFLAYMSDEHKQRFNCDYQPFGSWAQERGLLSNLVGTKTKQGKYAKELLKGFIDYCFKTYVPTSEYKGISFGFMWTYKKSLFQTIEVRYNRRMQDKKAVSDFKPTESDLNDIAEWFGS